jgi:hypothetical protein
LKIGGFALPFVDISYRRLTRIFLKFYFSAGKFSWTENCQAEQE